MARWQEDARGRLLRSAIELFTKNGYETTTAAQIAAHAGLTKTTLFRHFADKREILFQGQQAQVALAVAGVESAPALLSAFEALSAGVLAICEIHTPDHREIGRQLEAITSRSPELQERASFKRATITRAVQDALVRRGEDARSAGLLADVGMRAFYEGFGSWIATARRGSLATFVRAELSAYRDVVVRTGNAVTLLDDQPR